MNRIFFYLLSLIVVPLFVSLSISFADPIVNLERRIGDLKYSYFHPETDVSDRVVLIDIDDFSLQSLKENPSFGRWPWKRSVYAPLLQYIMEGEPQGILFDILFSEASAEDKILEDLSTEIPIISHAFHSEPGKPEGWIPDQLHKFDLGKKAGSLNLPDSAPVLLPSKKILFSASHLHGVSYVADEDGVARDYPLAYKMGPTVLPSLGLQALLFIAGKENCEFESKLLTCGKSNSIPHDKGLIPIHYPSLSALERIRRIPVAYILQSYNMLSRNIITDPQKLPVPPETFRGKVVILGATALSTYDNRITPYGIIPGPLIQAAVASNLIANIHRINLGRTHEFLLLLCFSILVSYTFIRKIQFRIKILLFVVFLMLAIAGNFLLFYLFSIYIPFFLGLVHFPLTFIIFVSFLVFQEKRDKDKLSNAMSKYVAPEIVEDILSKRNIVAEIGSRKVISLLFSDIRGFTSYSENSSPEETVKQLNEYLSVMVKCLISCQGTLDKFIGDAIMAFWNAPNPNPNHAELAVQSSVAMSLALRKLNQAWRQEGRKEWKMGIGIHTGEAIVGNIGSEERINYTAIGDTVNLASRTEGLTKKYGSEILITESVYKQIQNQKEFNIRYLGKETVKGKEIPVAIYEVRILESEAQWKNFQKDQDLFAEAIRHFEKQNWKEAKNLFSKLKSKEEDPTIQQFLKKLDLLKKD